MQFSHVSITVKDMEKSIRFYSEAMGLELISRRVISEQRENAFLNDKISNIRIELTFWKDKTEWTSGDELDHLAFTVPKIDEVITELRRQEVEIIREPFSLKDGTTIAYIKDPNGIRIELVESR